MAQNDDVPQTVAQAVEMGWTALAFECRACKHEGHILFGDLVQKRRANWRLASVFARARCSECKLRPSAGKLAASINLDGLISWHEREVLFMDGFVVRPGRW